ncbi:CDP-diacylglycerol--glycerol-3-phosphate 3-phosphatidyltransferase [Aliiroseovarius sp. YM-037]|uniref:CDP-diacylglycerol--glycerol-3-phosphate 3-phosphatidyltransferase n=1 Tax=Aliiroseovarius sp. YM-037 TaxID=3341728 RepID=UPI003A7FBE98
MNWNLPNILTVLRLLAAPGVAVMFLYFTRPYADWFALLLFAGAAITDFFDGYLARAWKQESKFGAMLDPIADKAMVVIALLVIVGYSSMSPWLVLPATVILFREVFVSGLREFLGDTAGTLKVTKLAKWKTTVQMVAIAVLFAQGVFEHYLGISAYGMDQALVDQIMTGQVEDLQGLRWKFDGMIWTGHAGLWLLWLAAVLTFLTGWDYFSKALPFLKEEPRD